MCFGGSSKGFNSTLRRGNVTHHEYIQMEKARVDVATSKHELEAVVVEKIEVEIVLNICRRELQLVREEIDTMRSKKSFPFTT